jgi:hypothetical protein
MNNLKALLSVTLLTLSGASMAGTYLYPSFECESELTGKFSITHDQDGRHYYNTLDENWQVVESANSSSLPIRSRISTYPYSEKLFQTEDIYSAQVTFSKSTMNEVVQWEEGQCYAQLPYVSFNLEVDKNTLKGKIKRRSDQYTSTLINENATVVREVYGASTGYAVNEIKEVYFISEKGKKISCPDYYEYLRSVNQSADVTCKSVKKYVRND